MPYIIGGICHLTMPSMFFLDTVVIKRNHRLDQTGKDVNVNVVLREDCAAWHYKIKWRNRELTLKCKLKC